MHAEEVARLVDRFGPEIYRYCRRLTGGAQQAEDLYQQTFLKCLELTLTLDEQSNPRALLFSLAGGIFKNEQRKAGRRLAIARPVELDAESDARAVSLWWLPMVANFIVCGVPAVIFALPIMPLWAHLASFALAWLAVGGVALTFISLHMADLRAATTIYLPKRTRKKEGF